MAAAKLPDDVACRAVDLENGGVVACGDQIVSVGILVDAVDVEVIPFVGRIAAVEGAFWTKWEEAVYSKCQEEGFLFLKEKRYVDIDFATYTSDQHDQNYTIRTAILQSRYPALFTHTTISVTRARSSQLSRK